MMAIYIYYNYNILYFYDAIFLRNINCNFSFSIKDPIINIIYDKYDNQTINKLLNIPYNLAFDKYYDYGFINCFKYFSNTKLPELPKKYYYGIKYKDDEIKIIGQKEFNEKISYNFCICKKENIIKSLNI